MIEVENITKKYTTGLWAGSSKIAVNKVSFSIGEGETLGLIGASGCGKSTLAKIVLKLIPFNEGRIFFDGKDITNLSGRELQRLRIKMQIMFQNPESSLNPRMKIYDSIAEMTRIHKILPKRSEEEKANVLEFVDLVGLQKEHLKRYPSELSGGQIQRAVLARVLSVEPRLLIADEPTSMLDVSVQAQILSLLKDMQKKFNFACLFIAHDLDVIRIMSQKVAVMYQGNIIEMGPTEKVLKNPLHPYTVQLVREYEFLSGKNEGKEVSVTSADDLDNMKGNSEACIYYDICEKKSQICSKSPTLIEKEEGHFAACWNEKLIVDRRLECAKKII